MMAKINLEKIEEESMLNQDFEREFNDAEMEAIYKKVKRVGYVTMGLPVVVGLGMMYGPQIYKIIKDLF